MKNPSFNFETLVRPAMGNDTKLRGAMPEMLDDGDDKHEKIQGPSAKIDGRHSSYNVNHGHARNGEAIYYGNPSESEDDLIARIDSGEFEDYAEFNDGIIGYGIEAHEMPTEYEMSESSWKDALRRAHQAEVLEKEHDHSSELLDNQYALQDDLGDNLEKPLDERALRSYKNAKNYSRNKRGLVTDTIVDPIYGNERLNGRWRGPRPAQTPKYKTVDTESIRHNVESGSKSDSYEQVINKVVHPDEKENSHYFKKDGDIQHYPELRQ